MKKFVMAAVAGTLVGAIATTQIAGPLLAQESKSKTSVYEMRTTDTTDGKRRDITTYI